VIGEPDGDDPAPVDELAVVLDEEHAAAISETANAANAANRGANLPDVVACSSPVVLPIVVLVDPVSQVVSQHLGPDRNGVLNDGRRLKATFAGVESFVHECCHG
jgi:hypothetical protein